MPAIATHRWCKRPFRLRLTRVATDTAFSDEWTKRNPGIAPSPAARHQMELAVQFMIALITAAGKR
jgi:hypothetical protein